MAVPPNAWFTHDMMFFGESLSRESLIAKGFYMDLPDVAQSSSAALDDLQDRARMMLALIGDDMAIQFQWSVDSDYREQLDKYDQLTTEKAANRWSIFTRAERVAHFREQMYGSTLRRERLAVFFSRKCNTIPKKGFRAESEIDFYLTQQAKGFMDKIDTVRMIMPDADIRPMDDREHFFYSKSFFNPSMNRVHLAQEARYNGFDESESMLDQCAFSDAMAIDLEEMAAFKMDGHYHTMIVVRRWPQQTFPGIIKGLTQSVARNCSITQNIFPLSIVQEIEKEERQRERLQGDAAHGGRYSLYTSIGRKETKIASLMAGFTLPYNVLTVIRVWDQTIEGLYGKSNAIKTALQNMAGAQYHQCNHGAQAKNIFIETIPGWLGGKTREWDLYAESHYMADLLPLSSTFTGDLDAGEAVYDGTQGGMVGVKTFSGDTPQHALILGMRGSGKSLFAADLLSQTEPFYEYTAIIEEGLSYGTYTETMGSKPIIISPNSDQTLNYFDTLGAPLSGEMLSMGSALCLQMAGTSRDEDTNNHRLAVITEYIQQLYWDTFTDWKQEHDEAYEDICRMAYGLDDIRKRLPTGSSQLDAFSRFTEWKLENEDEVVAWLAGHPHQEILSFSKNPQNEVDIRNLAMSQLDRDQFPIHQTLVEILRHGRMRHHRKDETDMLATLLTQWTRNGGTNGNLFDGPTNMVLGQRIDHFELGLIPESNLQLKSAAGFLIANMIRQTIITRPRAQRKRIVFEEVSRFLDIPNADKIVSQYYAQMRKFGCWVLTISQQVEQLMQTPLWPVIKGNCTEFFFLRQNNLPTIQMLARETGLPDIAMDAIRNYPLPEHFPENQRPYSSATYMTMTSRGPVCGTLRNYPSEEMLYMAASNAATFDERSRVLTNYEDPVDGILEEVEKKRQARRMRRAA